MDEVGGLSSMRCNEAKLKKLIMQPNYQVELKGQEKRHIDDLIIISLLQIVRLQLKLRELIGDIVFYNVAPNIAHKDQNILGHFLIK